MGAQVPTVEVVCGNVLHSSTPICHRNTLSGHAVMYLAQAATLTEVQNMQADPELPEVCARVGVCSCCHWGSEQN